MDVLFVDELDIFARAVIPAQHLDVIGLNRAAFFDHPFIFVGHRFFKKTRPLAVSKGVVVQKLQLLSQVGNQTGFVDGKVLITLFGQQADKFLFKSRFALETVRACAYRRILGNNGAFVVLVLGNDVVSAHAASSSISLLLFESQQLISVIFVLL